MNILYLSNTRFAKTPYRDGSTRYRCYNYAEELSRLGHVADVAVIGEIDPEIIPRYDAVVVLRPVLNKHLEAVIDSARDAGAMLIADFDDLVFNPELASESPAVLNRQAGLDHVSSVFTRHCKALQCFDKVTVATQELLWQVQTVVPDASVLHLPNGLSSYWLEYNKHVIKPQSCSDISYMPGTRSHDQDFALVQSVISEKVNSSDNLRCRIIGALDIDETLFEEQKLERGSWIDYFSLPQVIANSFVTIAPLADTAFNRCKSHIKFLESAAFGTPVITSNIPDISQHHVDGLSIVTSDDEWKQEIERYTDPEYYLHCQTRLSEYVRTHCMAANSATRFIDFIEASANTSDHEDITVISKAS